MLKLALANQDYLDEENQYISQLEKISILSKNIENETSDIMKSIEIISSYNLLLMLDSQENNLLSEIERINNLIKLETRVCAHKTECNSIVEDLNKKPPFKALKE